MFYDIDHNSFTEEEMKAILKVLRTGKYTAGENVDLFEKLITEKLGVKYAVMMNSGSSAMLVAAASLLYKKENPIKKGDEVILPAFSAHSTASAFHHLGMKLKFVDIDMATLTLDTQYLERALTPNTKVIVVTNTMGNPGHLDVVRAFAKKNSLVFIEDNLDGLGSEFKGKKCGTYGDIGVLSTSSSHQISTMEGGVLVTEDREIYHLAKALRGYGIVKNLPPESPLFQKGTDEWWEESRCIVPGFNFRPLEVCGAVGAEQIRKLDAGLEVRRINRATFQELFNGDPRFILQKDNGKSSWYGFTIIINPVLNVNFSNLMKLLNNEGIACRPILGGNLVKHDVIRCYDHEVISDLRISNLAHDRGFYVGNYAQDLTKQLERLNKVLVAACGGVIKKAA